MADPNVTAILEQLERGDSGASDRLLPLVYEELRRLARHKMTQEAAGHSLQPTALVHEAYLRLVGDGNDAQTWQNRGHFYAAAAEAMRRILIESARRKAALKHGGELDRVAMPDIAAPDAADHASLLALDDALVRLKSEDPDSHQLIMLRYFGGLTIDETAAALGISERTAKRNWSFARAWLIRAMGD